MRRRTAAAVCCVAIVTLAGCSFGLGGGGGGGNPAAYTQSADELNASTLQADHTGTLDANSFTLQEALLVDSPNRSASLNRTVAVDGERRHARSVLASRTSGGSLETQRFTNETVTYQLFSITTPNRSSTQYRRATPPYAGGTVVRPVNESAARKHRFVRLLVETVNWTQTGVVERDGEQLTRYVATGEENVTDFREEADISPTAAANLSQLQTQLSDIRLELYLTKDGVVREFRVDLSGTANGRQISVTYLLRTTDVGSTTVEPPDWLDEAKNASQSGGGAY